VTGHIPETTIQQLEDTLVHEAAEYRQLVALTAREQAALKASDLAELNDTIREKQSLLPKISHWTTRRERLTAALAARFNLPTDATLTDLLAHVEGAIAEKMIALREEFIELMEQLIVLNHTNKMILQTELARVDSTYDFITAMFSEPNDNYAPPGASQSGNNRGYILNWEI